MDPDPDEHLYPGVEELQWGEGVKLVNREKVPHAQYTVFGEQARKIIPSESLCKMFCGGKTCKYCSSTNWRPEQMVINGLYSEWVTHNILAMARMSNEQIEKYGIIKQFQEHDIKTVINLEQRDEHAYCGLGNGPSGFSYNPQILMENGIFFYNFAMEDYGVASMPKLLDIVKVMQFAVSLGKVAVHCHAGLGRTGLIIACYLIYNNRISAPKAVQYVRSRRPGSIQTKQQMRHCYKFEEFLKVFFIVFSSKVPDANPVSFRGFLIRQRQLLHGYEARKLKHIPKVVYVCCERLLELCGKGTSLTTLRNTVIDRAPSDLESRVGNLTDRDLSPSEPDSLASSLNYDGSGALSESWRSPVIENTLDTPRSVNGLNKRTSMTAEIFARKLKRNERCIGDDVDEEDNVVFSTGEDEDASSIDSLNGSMITPVCSAQKLCEHILQAYSTSDVDKVNNIEEMLNKSETGWQDLAREESPQVIFLVMTDWIDQLSEAILRSQDVSLILEHSSNPDTAFNLLETSTKHFLTYIILVLKKLNPGVPELHEKVLQLFLTHLCQKQLNVCKALEPPSASAARSDNITNSLRPEEAHQLFQTFQNLVHSRKRKSKSHNK